MRKTAKGKNYLLVFVINIDNKNFYKKIKPKSKMLLGFRF